MKTVHVITCFHRRFAVDSLAQATTAIQVLSKLRRIEYTSANSNSDRGHYEYAKDDAEIELSMELNQKVYSPPKHLALPPLDRLEIGAVERQSATLCWPPTTNLKSMRRPTVLVSSVKSFDLGLTEKKTK